MTADNPVVEAVARAIHGTPLYKDGEQSRFMPPDPSGWELRAAEAAVAAAWPVFRETAAAAALAVKEECAASSEPCFCSGATRIAARIRSLPAPIEEELT